MALKDELLGTVAPLQSMDQLTRERVHHAEKDPRISRRSLHCYRTLQDELFLHLHEVLGQCREMATLSDLPDEAEEKLRGVMKELQLAALRGTLMAQYATMLLDAMLEGPDRDGPDAPLTEGMPDLPARPVELRRPGK